MPFDQYLLNSHFSYSGSYTDNLFYRNEYLIQEQNSGTPFSPLSGAIGYWAFQDDLTDSVGSFDLSVYTGSISYVTGYRNNVKAARFNGETILARNSLTVESQLNLWDSSFNGTHRQMSVEVMIKPSGAMNNFSHGSDPVSQSIYLRNGVICVAISASNSTTDIQEDKISWGWELGAAETPTSINYSNPNSSSSINNGPVYRENIFSVAHSSSNANNYEVNTGLSGTINHFTGTLNQGYYPDIWQHLAVTYEEGTGSTGGFYSNTKYYINGELLKTFTTQGSQATFDYSVPVERNDSVFFVGGISTGSQTTGSSTEDPVILDRFIGDMSHLVFYHRVLSEKELYDRYNNIFGTKTRDKLFLGSKTSNVENVIVNKITDNNFQFNTEKIYAYSNNFYNSKNSGFVKLLSNEQIWDSLVASPVDYHLKNEASLVLGAENLRPLGKLSNNAMKANNYFYLPLFAKTYPKVFVTGSPGEGNRSNYVLSGSEMLKIGDTAWEVFFPFEQKYKSLQKLSKPSNFLDKEYVIKISDSGSMHPIQWGGVSVPGSGGIGNSISATDGLLNNPVKTNIFSGIFTIISDVADPSFLGTNINEPNLREVIYYLNTLGNTNFNDLNIIFNNVTGTLNNIDLDLASYTRTMDGMISNPELVDTYKFYFGRGRKAQNFHQLGPGIRGASVNNKFPSFQKTLTDLNTLLNSEPAIGLGVKISGWRYGLYSAIPSATSITFRRDRYGQLRDMLEQRQFTRFSRDVSGRMKANRTRSDRGVVQIRFVEGSQSEISASNPSLNVNDSGIYTRLYTSGKPYSDSQD